LTTRCFTHPKQLACLKARTPAFTLGSLIQATIIDALVQLMRTIVTAANPLNRLDDLVAKLQQLTKTTPSAKHMSGRDLGRLAPPLPAFDHQAGNPTTQEALAPVCA
jgi:type II secretory pathway component PulJ